MAINFKIETLSRLHHRKTKQTALKFGKLNAALPNERQRQKVAPFKPMTLLKLALANG